MTDSKSDKKKKPKPGTLRKKASKERQRAQGKIPPKGNKRGRKPGQKQTPQCKATGKKSGKRCLNAAIPGGTVCRRHGGSAPQVKAAADRRILEAQEDIKQMLPAATRELKRLLEKGKSEIVRLNAINGIFDRAGLVVVKKNEHKISEGEYTFSIEDASAALDDDEEEFVVLTDEEEGDEDE